MACSLIEHKSINTTLAKAKALRVYVEPLLTKSKTDSTHSRRTVFSYLQDKEVVAELFREVAPKIASRNGGYTRIIRTGYRLGDNAEMCMIELVDFNEVYTKEAKTKTTRRSRRGGKKTTNAETLVEDAVVEETVETAAETSETKVAEATAETTEETTAQASEEPAAEATEEPAAEATEAPEVEADQSSEEDSNGDDSSSDEDKKEA
tara:strand:- start:660 stop:1280 length:621 start_codon:yes stop_codon:yes gene_type:complete